MNKKQYETLQRLMICRFLSFPWIVRNGSPKSNATLGNALNGNNDGKLGNSAIT